MDRGAWWAAVHGVTKSWTLLSDFTFTFHFHALEKEMATHSSVLAWRIPGTRGLKGVKPPLVFGGRRDGGESRGEAKDSALLSSRDAGLLDPLSLGFSRQEQWSGLPVPSSMHESEK